MNNEFEVIPGFEHIHIESYWSAEDNCRDKDGNFSFGQIPFEKPVIARAILSTAEDKRYIATMTYKPSAMEIDIRQWNSGKLIPPAVYSPKIDIEDFNKTEPIQHMFISHIDKSLCYQEYVRDWCEQHIPMEMVAIAKKKFNTMNDMLNPKTPSPNTFEQCVESGAAFGGFAPASFEEFLDMEYPDRDHRMYLHSRLAASAKEPSAQAPVHFNEISNLTISHYENNKSSKSSNFSDSNVIATGIFEDKNNDPYVIQLVKIDSREYSLYEGNKGTFRGMEMLLYKATAPSAPIDWELVPSASTIDKDAIEYYITKFAETSSALLNPEHNKIYNLSFNVSDKAKTGDSAQAVIISGTFRTQDGEVYTADIAATVPDNPLLETVSVPGSLFRLSLFAEKDHRHPLDTQDVLISNAADIDDLKKELTRFVLTTKSLKKENIIKKFPKKQPQSQTIR